MIPTQPTLPRLNVDVSSPLTRFHPDDDQTTTPGPRRGAVVMGSERRLHPRGGLKPSFPNAPSVAWWEPPDVRRRDLDDTGDSEMKNYAMPAAIAFLGLGLMSIGFNLNGNTATATPASFNAGPEEPTIVWYESHARVENSVANLDTNNVLLLRAWSDGTIERRSIKYDSRSDVGSCTGVSEGSECVNTRGWFVISSPNEGLNAAADINFDEVVDGGDLGQLLASWGNAPRNPMPPSDCPLGLIQ